jgi:hypothetical protein
MSKKVLEIDFEEKIELPVASFPPFKLRSSMVDKDPVIWVHLIEVFIQYVQTILQLNRSITERSEEQLCLFVRSYLREIASEQGQILSLGLINVQITENLDILKVWMLELVKQFGVLHLKLNGPSLWDFAKIYSPQYSELVRGIISGTFKPKSKRTINSISLVEKHIESLITNGMLDKIDIKIFAILLNEKSNLTSTDSSKQKSKSAASIKSANKTPKVSPKQASFSDSFVGTQWVEILEKLYAGGEGQFAAVCKDLCIISILSVSTGKIASLLTEMGITSYRALALTPLFAGIITSEQFKKLYPDLPQKLPFLNHTIKKKVEVNQDDVNTLIEFFPSLSISHSEKLLRKNNFNVETVTNLLLENPDLAIPKDKESTRHVYEDDSHKNIDLITRKEVRSSKSLSHVPDEHQNKTLTAALRLMYEADEDERDDTYDEAEAATISTNNSESSKLEKIEMLLWNLFKKNQSVFDRGMRKTKQRKELKSETSWSDEQIEGWAKMIQKSPKRAKLLEEKYMFRGNKPWTSSFYKAEQEQEEVEVDKKPLSEAKPPVNQQLNNTPAANSNTNVKRTQARNEKNKSSRANHNRKTGHDKKMAKGF